MTLAQDCAWALLRSAGIAAVAVSAAAGIRRLIACSSRRAGRLVWLLHFVPYLTPALLVGYAYSRFSLSLVRHPEWNVALYMLLVWLKLVPLATLILHFAPAPLSPEGIHCHRLVGRHGVGRSWRTSPLAFWLRGAGRVAAAAFAVVFLLAFGEFEMASLLGVRTWTVALFDAQVGGLALGASLRLVAPAVVCEAAVLALALVLLFAHRAAWARPGPSRRRLGRGLRAMVWAYLAFAAAVVTVLPALVVLRGTLRGLGLLAQTLALTRDVVASMVFGAAAAAGAALLAAWVLRGTPQSGRWRKRWGSAACACVPGLLGPLVLSLLVLALFQLRVLRALDDTPAPLVAALALLLLPFALLLRLLLVALRPAESVRAAELLELSPSRRVVRVARRILYELRGRGRFWAALLLFWWGYLDLTASSILAPSRMTPVLVRLYNFMHYGQTAVLSAMVCVAFAAPLVLLLFVAMARRAWRWS